MSIFQKKTNKQQNKQTNKKKQKGASQELDLSIATSWKFFSSIYLADTYSS